MKNAIFPKFFFASKLFLRNFFQKLPWDEVDDNAEMSTVVNILLVKVQYVGLL